MSEHQPPYVGLRDLDELPDRLGAALRYRGISQTRLAVDLGVNPGTISRLMTGQTRNVGAVLLRAIAQYLDVQTDYLLGLSGSMQRPRLRPGSTTGESDRGDWRDDP